MKELSIEEKAKAYDKALQKAKYLHEAAANGRYDEVKTFECIFPELKESEDERIRQKFIKLIKMSSEVGGFALHKWEADEMLAWLEKQNTVKFNDEKDERIRKEIISALKYANHEGVYNKHLAWLEKQGEYKSVDDIQKPTYIVEPRFKVGDYIKHDKANIIYKVVSVNSGYYYVENIETDSRIELFNAEQNFHLWTIQDAKDGDVLLSKHNQPFIYNGIFDEESIGAYCGIDNLGNDFLVDNFSCDWSYKEGVKPATKEQHDLLFQKMREAGYEWDAEKKELRKIEPKIAESEDERIRKELIKYLKEGVEGYIPAGDRSDYQRWLTWLEKQGEQMKTPEESLDISSDKWNDIVDRCLFD